MSAGLDVAQGQGGLQQLKLKKRQKQYTNKWCNKHECAQN